MTKKVSATKALLMIARDDLKAARLQVSTLRAKVKELRDQETFIKQNAAAERIATKQAKQAVREQRKLDRIQKLQERLAKLTAPSLKKAKRQVTGGSKWSKVTKFNADGTVASVVSA